MCKITKDILGISDNNIKFIKIENKMENKKINKYIHIKKTTKRELCTSCSCLSSYHYDTRKVNIKHLKSANYNTFIVVHKKRFYCKICKKVFTEHFNFISKGKKISNSLSAKMHIDLKDNVSFKYVAKINNVSTTHVRNTFNKNVDYYKYEILFPEVISIDEFKADTPLGKYACIINDPINKKTIDILPSRRKQEVLKYLKKVKNKEEVKIVISDMWEPYLQITQSQFKNAKYVVDKFHYVRYVMSALDTIRINLQKTYDSRHTRYLYNLLKNKKNVALLRKYSEDIDWQKVITITNKDKNKRDITVEQRLNDILNICPTLSTAYQLKESFLEIIHTSKYEEAEDLLKQWIDVCYDSDLTPFIEASTTIHNWLPYIVNSFIDKRYTNGYTEGLNTKIKTHKRVAYGYYNFYTMRNRLLYILEEEIKG